MHKRRILGNQAEELATTHLRRQGLKILRKNLKTKLGEIDILAQDGRSLVVVEVKAKTNPNYGGAIEMITPAKRKKLLLLAHELQMKYQKDSVRVDVVAIDEFLEGPKITYYRGVVEDE